MTSLLEEKGKAGKLSDEQLWALFLYNPKRGRANDSDNKTGTSSDISRLVSDGRGAALVDDEHKRTLHKDSQDVGATETTSGVRFYAFDQNDLYCSRVMPWERGVVRDRVEVLVKVPSQRSVTWVWTFSQTGWWLDRRFKPYGRK